MNRLQFSLLGLLLLMTGLAAYARILSYFRTRHSVVLFAVPLVAMAIMVTACLVPGRHGKWVRPTAVVLVCLGCFALGLWLHSH